MGQRIGRKLRYSLLSIGLLLLFPVCHSLAMEVYDLTCEMQRTPLAIENLQARLGWKLRSDLSGDKQTAYQLQVFEEDRLLWNSGRKSSGQSQLVAYQGKPLRKGSRYYWKVKVWDSRGKASESALTFFETAPELTGVEWIGAISRADSHLPVGRRDFHGPSFKKAENKAVYDKIDPLALQSILLRKSFHTGKKVEKAILHVSGLGHYELSMNGRTVSDNIFTPVWSDYDKTVYYNTYQVDSLLQTGENAIGVLLGNGFYNAMGKRYRKLWVSFGPPTLFLRLYIRYSDGTTETIASDKSWKYTLSPIVFNDIYGGEDYDARMEIPGWNTPDFDDKDWKPVVCQEAPEGVLRAQQIPSVKIMREYPVVGMSRIDSSYVLDMGQNLAGYPLIKVMGRKGQSIKITVGELLNEQTGKVSQKQSGGPHTYTYVLKGEGVEEWHPRFTYYGFRYIQVDGAYVLSQEAGDKPLVLDIRSCFIHNSVPEVGHFESSNEIFNQAHVLIKNAVKSNMQSVFTDCPHREKLGWLEETHLNGPGLLYNWDLTQFYPKVMRDIADAQTKEGLVPTIVPEYVQFDESLKVFRDSPEWGIASILVPGLYYRYYGDMSLIRKYFEVMTRYVDYMSTLADGHITDHGLGDWYDYGEHRAGFSMNSPVAVSSTAHYYYAALKVSEYASMLGKKNEAKRYKDLSARIRSAFNAKFFDKQSKQYGTGSQFCNAIALFMELVEPQYREAVLENLKADIRQRGNRLTTGDVGNRYLFMTLALNGENELMYLMHNHYDAPGYGFQLKFGVTTLTEQWDPRKGASWNHFMMGQIDEWFFHSLVGLSPKEPGFREFWVRPSVVGDLKYVKARHQSLYGEISVSWTREGKSFTLEVDVPVNSTAHVVLPDGSERRIGSGRSTITCNLN